MHNMLNGNEHHGSRRFTQQWRHFDLHPVNKTGEELLEEAGCMVRCVAVQPSPRATQQTVWTLSSLYSSLYAVH